MQEEVESRTLTLAVNGTKFTGRMLKAAVAKFMAYRRSHKAAKACVHPKGKQTVKGRKPPPIRAHRAQIRRGLRCEAGYLGRCPALPRVL